MNAGAKAARPLEEGRRSRCVHYAIAHRELPQVVFQYPDHALAQLESAAAETLLARCWTQAARRCWDFSRHVPISPDGRASGLAVRPVVSVRRASVCGRRCVVLELPKPVSPPEAHFVAVLQSSRTTHGRRETEPATDGVRYLTLEEADSGGPPTFLCEWTSRLRHVSLGEGPRPDVRAFVEAIANRLVEEAKQRATVEPMQYDVEADVRSVTLPGMLELERLTAGDVLDDLAGSGMDVEIVRSAYHADPEGMIARPWQVETLRALGAQATTLLVASLEDTPRRPWAILLLGVIGPAAAAHQSALLPCLSDPAPETRALALEAMASMAPIPLTAWERIRSLMEHDDPRVRRSATHATGHLERRTDDARAALEARFRDDDRIVRNLAAHHLARVQNQSPDFDEDRTDDM